MVRIISFIYLLALIIVSLIPLSGTVSPGNTDKIAHFFIYALLGILGYYVSKSFKQKIYILAAILALGILLELAQILIPTRQFSYLDIAANLAGSIFGFFVPWMIRVSRQTPSFGGCGSPQTTVPVKNVEDENPR